MPLPLPRAYHLLGGRAPPQHLHLRAHQEARAPLPRADVGPREGRLSRSPRRPRGAGREILLRRPGAVLLLDAASGGGASLRGLDHRLR